MSGMQRIIIATRNQYKAREFAQLLGREFATEDLSTIANAVVVAETGSTFAENAALKALAVSNQVPELVLADDSGLEVDALGGAPGVYSARFAGEGASDRQNLAKLLDELACAAPENRGARFRCALALARAGEIIHRSEGVVEGKIATAPGGVVGFGYDPVFIPAGYDLTFAEMPAATKNQISHRARAVAALKLLLLAGRR